STVATSARIVRVAVPVPLYALYDYHAGDALPCPGTRVVVPFGRREHVAMVIATDVVPAVPESQLKAIVRCLDDAPLLGAPLLKLCRWCARYYHHPLGEVLASALPVALRRAQAAERQTSRG